MSRLPGPRTPFGHLLWGARLLRRPYGTLLAAHERFGPVVQIGLGPLRFVYLFGRDANELILSTHARDFTWREAFASLIPVDGDTALVVSDGDDHARRRRLVQPAFALRRLRDCAPTITEEIDRTLAGWRPGEHLDLHVELQATVRRIAIRTLFGDRLAARADELGELLEVAIGFADLPPLPGRDLDLPGSPFRRAMRARAKADEIVFAEIARRRADPGDQGDLLSALVAAQEEDGSNLTDQELRDQVVSLIAAGYHTTGALVAWALYAVLRAPAVEERLRGELADAFGDGALDEARLEALPFLHGVVMEALRLHSPAGVAGRKSHADVELAGHTVAAGSMVVYSQHVTHRQPELWPDPLAFRPERWFDDDGRPVDPDPYAFVPFGGGYRRCIGFALATLEAKVIVAETVRRSRLRLERTTIQPTGLAAVVPKGGVPVTVL